MGTLFYFSVTSRTLSWHFEYKRVPPWYLHEHSSYRQTEDSSGISMVRSIVWAIGVRRYLAGTHSCHWIPSWESRV